MKIRIREGNDFDVAWAIKRAGVPEDLSTAINMKLTLVVHGLVIEHNLFTVTDNVLSINIPKEVATINGDYRLIFEYTLPDAGQPDGDLKCKTDVVPFRIVPFTAMADDIYTINVTSDIAFGFKGDKGDNGDDAYQIWLDLGNEGTYEDFIAYLRQPAIDAGVSISELEGEIQVSEGLRVQAESERDLAEVTRVQSESERLAAETIRQSNEGGRVENEDTRAQNEAERISKENVRQSNETDRVEAEGIRQSNEIDRIEAEGIRVQAESDRVELYNDMMQLKTDTTTAKNDATEQAGYAKNMGDYAQAQGDYAKQQGDLLSNRMPLFYGVEFAKGSLDPNSTRWIGDDAFKSNHVIFNDFKVAKVKDGKVVGVLNQTNWFEMEDGTPSGVVIDGTDVTDDGCDIMLVNEKGFYVLNGGTDPDFERRIVSDAPFHYGNDRAIYIEPFGMTVDFAIVKDGVSRCIRDNTHSGTATTGNGGVSYLADGLGVPTTYVSRFGAEGYARAKNVDTSLNTPYANTFQLDKNVWATLLFIKFQTKDLHNQDCVGPCISANDSSPNIWGDKTGIRVKNVDETYSHYNTNSSRFMSAAGGTSWNFYQLINNYRPLLKIFDCQLALSHAKQNNIPQNTLFEFDGFQYSYENIQGSKGIADGEMTAKVRKFVTVQFTGYDNVDKVDVVDKDVEYCFEQGVVHGKIAGWGNIWEWVSGLEGVIDGSDNSRYHFYQTNDVRKLTTDSDSTNKENGEVFAFQNSYDYLGSDTNTNGYVRQMFDNSLMGMTIGGSLHTAECGYRYSSTSADAGKLVRRGVYFGGHAYHAHCALRLAYANHAPTSASTNIGFGFRVTLP